MYNMYLTKRYTLFRSCSKCPSWSLGQVTVPIVLNTRVVGVVWWMLHVAGAATGVLQGLQAMLSCVLIAKETHRCFNIDKNNVLFAKTISLVQTANR